MDNLQVEGAVLPYRSTYTILTLVSELCSCSALCASERGTRRPVLKVSMTGAEREINFLMKSVLLLCLAVSQKINSFEAKRS